MAANEHSTGRKVTLPPNRNGNGGGKKERKLMVLKCERKSKEEPNEVSLAPNETSTKWKAE